MQKSPYSNSPPIRPIVEARVGAKTAIRASFKAEFVRRSHGVIATVCTSGPTFRYLLPKRLDRSCS